MKYIQIGKRRVGEGYPCFVIAEASSNHGGSLRRAKLMIKVAADAGADAVKFQVFKAEQIASDTSKTLVKNKTFVKSKTKLVDIYKANELPRFWLKRLFKYAESLQIMFLATPFDENAVDELEAIGVYAYKIASYELLDVPLLRKVAKTGKPIILSTGMADLKEIGQALKIIRHAGNNQIILLHCRSTYPLPFGQVDLKAMDTMRQRFKTPVGFSDHTLGIQVPMAAAALGANVLEKHFKLDDGLETIDNKFSLTEAELKQMVDGIRKVEVSLGESKKFPTQSELMERRFRRSLWVIEAIKKGDKFTKGNVKSLRPALGLSPLLIDKVLTKKAKGNINKNTPLLTRHVNQ